MKVVGVRKPKDRLSSYLRMVRNGEEILITRGEIVAELREPSPRQASAYRVLLEAARQGRVRIGLPNSPDIYPILKRVTPEGTAARLLDEGRGER